jgi:alanine dehydrogenase
MVPSGRLRIGFPKEPQNADPRIILTPALAHSLRSAGFALVSEPGIGARVGISDADLCDAGVTLADDFDVWQCPLLLKYKAFRPAEIDRLRSGQAAASVFHAEGNSEVIKALLRTKARLYSYEFLEEDGRFPLMRAGGHIAGVQSVLLAARHLQTDAGGPGVLLGLVPGAEPTRVLVIGSGNVGAAAARTAHGLGADVTVLGHTRDGCRDFLARCDHPATVRVNGPTVLREELARTDVVIGAILISTYSTPPMITESDLHSMKPGAVIVDATCGYGEGYLPTAGPVQRPEDPPYVVHGVRHVKIDTLPSLVPVSATQAYAAAAVPYLLRLAAAIAHNTTDPLWETALIAEDGEVRHPVVKEHAEIYGIGR